MKAEETNIFISYRRVDGRDIARTIQLALEKHGFKNVFFDYSSMREGAFNTQILTAIENCKDFLLVLSPMSMSRCSVEGDWVATEISKAISTGCNIIPVSINEPFDNWPEDFPRQFNILKRLQMLTLRTDEYFESSVDRLIGWLESEPVMEDNKAAEPEKFSLTITVDETCELYVDGKKIRKIKGGHPVVIDNIEKNVSHRITLNSLAHRGDPIEQEYIFSGKYSDRDQLSFSFSEMRENEKKQMEIARKLKNEEKQAKFAKDGNLRQVASLYDDSGLQNEGMLAVMKNGKIGFLDESSFEIIPCIYDDVSAFYYGYSTVCFNGLWEIIDKFGQKISRFSSDTPCMFMPGGRYYTASRRGKFNVFPLDPKRMVTDPIFPYDSIAFIDEYENLFFGEKNGIWKMESTDNVPVPFSLPLKSVETFNYYKMHFFNLHFLHDPSAPQYVRFPARIQNIQTGRYGYLNSKFKLAISFVDELSGEECYYWDYKIIQSHGRMGLVNAESGQTLLPPSYTYVSQIYSGGEYPFFTVGEECSPYRYEIDANGKRKNDWWRAFGGYQGVVDIEGNFIVPIQYQMIWYSMSEDSFSFFVACKLTNCTISYSKFSLDNKFRGELQFDSVTSEIHVYSTEGKLLMKGKYDELEKINIRQKLMESGYK